MSRHKDPYHPEGAKAVRNVLLSIIGLCLFLLGFMAGAYIADRNPGTFFPTSDPSPATPTSPAG